MFCEKPPINILKQNKQIKYKSLINSRDKKDNFYNFIDHSQNHSSSNTIKMLNTRSTIYTWDKSFVFLSE